MLNSDVLVDVSSILNTESGKGSVGAPCSSGKGCECDSTEIIKAPQMDSFHNIYATNDEHMLCINISPVYNTDGTVAFSSITEGPEDIRVISMGYDQCSECLDALQNIPEENRETVIPVHTMDFNTGNEYCMFISDISIVY